MILAALDPSTRTGWAVAESFTGRPRMRVGSWQLPEKAPIHEKVDALRYHLISFIKAEGIRYFLVETPTSGLSDKEHVVETDLGFKRQVKRTGSIVSQNQLWCIHGAALAVIGAFSIPYRTALARTWRAGLWRGEGNMRGPESKRRCAEMLHKWEIHCPNQDAAEAGAMLAFLNLMVKRFQLEDSLQDRPAA